MTVATQNNFVILDGDNVAVTFPFDFPVYDASHIYVFLQDTTTLVQSAVDPSNFTVTGVGDPNGGSVILSVAPLTTQKVIIVRILPYQQLLEVMNQGGFYPENVEAELDLLQMQIQQIKEELGRTVRVPLGETLLDLPAPPARRGLYLYFTDDVLAAPALATLDQQDAWLLEGSTGSGGGGGFSSGDEQFVRDTINAALIAGALISLTITGTNITIAVDTTALDERVRDTIGATLVAGANTNIVVDDTGNTITISYTPTTNIQSVVSAATVTPTFDNDQVNVTAQAVGLTVANPTGTSADAHGIIIRIKDNGTPRAITWGTKYRAFNDALPTTTTANKTLYVGVLYNLADDKWDVLGVRAEA